MRVFEYFHEIRYEERLLMGTIIRPDTLEVNLIV